MKDKDGLLARERLQWHSGALEALIATKNKRVKKTDALSACFCTGVERLRARMKSMGTLKEVDDVADGRARPRCSHCRSQLTLSIGDAKYWKDLDGKIICTTEEIMHLYAEKERWEMVEVQPLMAISLKDEDKKRLQYEVTAGKVAIDLTAPPPSSLANQQIFGIELPQWTGSKEKLVEDFEKGFEKGGLQYKPLYLWVGAELMKTAWSHLDNKHQTYLSTLLSRYRKRYWGVKNLHRLKDCNENTPIDVLAKRAGSLVQRDGYPGLPEACVAKATGRGLLPESSPA